jgi:DNA-binding MarR family transcriptional regulator
MEAKYESNAYLFGAFKKLEKAYTEYLLKKLGKYQLSPNEIEVLCALPHTTSAREIVLMIDVSKGLVSRSVKSLKAKGYITATLSSKDKREQCLQLTEDGESVRLEIERARAQFFEKAFEHYEGTERQVFEALVKLLTKNLDIDV